MTPEVFARSGIGTLAGNTSLDIFGNSKYAMAYGIVFWQTAKHTPDWHRY